MLTTTGPRRPAFATRNASSRNSGTRSGRGTVITRFATGWSSVCWSSSWKVSRPRCSLEGSPAITTTGEYASFAAASPSIMLATPGPACPQMKSPGVWVTRP